MYNKSGWNFPTRSIFLLRVFDMQPPARRSILAVIFISPNEPRLRAGWRLLAQTALMLPFTCLSLVILLIRESFSFAVELLLLQGVGLFSITLSVFLARRFIDRRSFTSLGLRLDRQALADTAAGLLMAALMMGLLALLLWAAGWLSPPGFSWQFAPNAAGQVALWLAIFVITGWNEELLSRGYHLQNLRDGLNLPWAVLLSSAVFGVAHIINPNASWVAVANITLAGIFFAFAYWRTQSLWLPIGLHIGWNFLLGVVFGFPVSGITTYRLANPEIIGPQAWTGGSFGPEAGLVILPILLFGALLVYGYTHRNVYPQKR